MSSYSYNYQPTYQLSTSWRTKLYCMDDYGSKVSVSDITVKTKLSLMVQTTSEHAKRKYKTMALF